jgi:hypothetical protein
LSEQVVDMARNGWTASIGIDGRHGPDYAGPGGHRPGPERTQLISLLEHDLLGGWHAIGRYAQYQKV